MQPETVPAHYWISRTVMNLCYAGFCIVFVLMVCPPVRNAASQQWRELQYRVALEQWKRRAVQVPRAWREAWVKPASDLPDEAQE